MSLTMVTNRRVSPVEYAFKYEVSISCCSKVTTEDKVLVTDRTKSTCRCPEFPFRGHNKLEQGFPNGTNTPAPTFVISKDLFRFES